MTYVMSDLHGAYRRYSEMIELIELKEDDVLFILGDVVDRGEMPVEILRDMMGRKNVIPLMGNHDCMAVYFLDMLPDDAAADDYESKLSEEARADFESWKGEGGTVTINSYLSLDAEERKAILSYLRSFQLYEAIDVGEKTFFLVHAGLGNFHEGKKLSDYTVEELIMSRCDPKTRFFDDESVYVIMGHTPTPIISGEASIYFCGNNIYVDCGACSPYGRLGCLRLDDMKEFYVN